MATAIMLQMHSRVTAVDVPEVCGSLASLAASSNYQLGEHMGWPAAKTSIETSTNWSLDQAPVAGGSHDNMQLLASLVRSLTCRSDNILMQMSDVSTG